MKKQNILFVAPMLFLLASLSSCSNEQSGGFCNVTFTGHNVSCDCPTYAPKNRDLDLVLDIHYDEREEARWIEEPTETKDGVLNHPNVEYTVSIEDIHVKIGGKEKTKSFIFFNQNNANNLLTIKKEYMTSNIEIEITARPRPYLFLFGYELGEELNNRWYGSESATTDPADRDLFVIFKTPYQSVRKPISSLSGREAFPVFEHDDMDVTFEVDEKKIEEELAKPDTDPDKKTIADLALPYDLRFRCESRYTLENIDYTREYSEPFGTFIDENGWVRTAYRKCHFKVPHFVVDDHGSFRQFGTE